MLLKWAVQGKRIARLQEAIRVPHTDNDCICATRSSGSSSSGKGDRIPTVSQDTVTHPGPTKLVMQRLVSQDRAIVLRDEKMMEASNPNPGQLTRLLTITMPPTPASLRIKLPTTALTFANMALLSRELEVNPFESMTFFTSEHNDDDFDSNKSTDELDCSR